MKFGKSDSINQEKLVKVADIYVITTSITSSYNDGSGAGPRCINICFLAKLNNGEYHELFSNKKIEKESDTHSNGFVFKKSDTPYLEKAEELKNYLNDENLEKIDIQLLFDFIVNMNISNSFKN